MKHKSYFGRNLKDAMNQAKNELGNDIIIVGSKKVSHPALPPFENNMVEITVAQSAPKSEPEVTPEIQTPEPEPNEEKSFYEYLPEKEKPLNNTEPAVDNSEDETFYLRNEVQKLNRRLQQMSSAQLPEPYSEIFEKLIRSGISADHCANLIRNAYKEMEHEPDPYQSKILSFIRSEVVSTLEDHGNLYRASKNKPRVIFALGATGVGKTTTIMKLSRHLNPDNDKKIAIITIDTYRVAASEPLKTFGRIASIPIYEAKSPDEMKDIIQTLDEMDIVLIDTPGRSPRFPNYIQELHQYLNKIYYAERLLLLSMTSDIDDLYLSSGLFLALKPSGIIFTKLDETGRPGKIVSIKNELALPIAYICDGQNFANGIRQCDGAYVWEKIQQS